MGHDRLKFVVQASFRQLVEGYKIRLVGKDSSHTSLCRAGYIDERGRKGLLRVALCLKYPSRRTTLPLKTQLFNTPWRYYESDLTVGNAFFLVHLAVLKSLNLGCRFVLLLTDSIAQGQHQMSAFT